MKKSKLYRKPQSTGKKFVKKRLYDNESWSEYRVRFIANNPKCYACGEVARIVDHVVSAKGDVKLFWDVTNMIPLCKKCHDILTANFDRHVVPKTEEKMKWINNSRLQKNVTFSVKVTAKNKK